MISGYSQSSLLSVKKRNHASALNSSAILHIQIKLKLHAAVYAHSLCTPCHEQSSSSNFSSTNLLPGSRPQPFCPAQPSHMFLPFVKSEMLSVPQVPPTSSAPHCVTWFTIIVHCHQIAHYFLKSCLAAASLSSHPHVLCLCLSHLCSIFFLSLSVSVSLSLSHFLPIFLFLLFSPYHFSFFPHHLL